MAKVSNFVAEASAEPRKDEVRSDMMNQFASVINKKDPVEASAAATAPAPPKPAPVVVPVPTQQTNKVRFTRM